MIAGLALVALALTACGSDTKAPTNAGSIVIQSAPSISTTVLTQWSPSLYPRPTNLDATTAGIVIAPPGTPLAGSSYVAGKGSVVYRVDPNGDSSTLSTPAAVTGQLAVAPQGAKNAGAVLVLTEQGLSIFAVNGSSTNIAIPSPAALLVAPTGTPHPGTAYVTSKVNSQLYIVDPGASSARTLDVYAPYGALAVAPAHTPNAGMVFVYPNPENNETPSVGDGDNPPQSPQAQLAEVEPTNAVRSVVLPTTRTGLGPIVGVAPAKTKYAGSLYLAGFADGKLYRLSPGTGLSSVQLLPSGDETVISMLIAGAGSKNAGSVYVGADQHILQVTPDDRVSALLTTDPTTAPDLLAIAPSGTSTAGTVYISPSSGGDSTVLAVKPDGSRTSYALAERVKPTSGTVAPAGTKAAGTLLVWGFYGQGVGELSPDGQTGVLGGDTGVIAVAVVPTASP